MRPTIGYILLPSVIISILYLTFLGHRPDYAGHFMAGFGGTLLMIVTTLEIQRRKEVPPSSGTIILIVLIACITFGTLQEATTFRLAKFDEVDYCNQNIGAVLAALSSLAVTPKIPEESPVTLPAMIVGLFFLFGGFHYAFQ